MFDVDVPGGVAFRESDTVAPGDEVVAVATGLGRLGLTICYDLRFGELFRALVERGAEAIFVPSAFTATTGKAHWEALLRARAIECQAWVLAPAQFGHHDDGGLRASHGQAMIVDPWGRVVAQAPDGVGFLKAVVADVSSHACIDPKRVYATGISNGSMMSQYLACQASDVFAAVGGVSGGASCRTVPRPVPLFYVHGTEDKTIGLSANQEIRATAVQDELTIEVWRVYERFVLPTALAVLRRIAASTAQDGGHK